MSRVHVRFVLVVRAVVSPAHYSHFLIYREADDIKRTVRNNCHVQYLGSCVDVAGFTVCMITTVLETLQQELKTEWHI